MAYLMSRTLCQGRRAGMVSLAGTTLGFTAHMLASAITSQALLVGDGRSCRCTTQLSNAGCSVLIRAGSLRRRVAAVLAMNSGAMGTSVGGIGAG